MAGTGALPPPPAPFRPLPAPTRGGGARGPTRAFRRPAGLPGRGRGARGGWWAVGGAGVSSRLGPAPGLRGTLFPASASCSLSACSTFHAAASGPARGRPGTAAYAPLSRARFSPRARPAHGRTFVSPRAPGSRRRQGADRTRHGGAAAAGWRADYGGGRGRRADETTPHPGNELGADAAGDGLLGRGTGRGGQRRGRGEPATGPGSAPQPPAAGAPGSPFVCGRQGRGAAAPGRPACGGGASGALGFRGTRGSAAQQPARAGLCLAHCPGISAPVALALELRPALLSMGRSATPPV